MEIDPFISFYLGGLFTGLYVRQVVCVACIGYLLHVSKMTWHDKRFVISHLENNNALTEMFHQILPHMLRFLPDTKTTFQHTPGELT